MLDAGLRITIAVAVMVLGLISPADAQEHHHESVVESIPLEILNGPVPLREGRGSFHDPVTTRSEQAPAYYDQGMAYLHSFVWIEAARSFNQALRLDSKLALAYVGLSYAYSGLNSRTAAVAALNKAQELASAITPREQARIAIRKAQLDAMADPANTALMAAYRRSIDDALARFPTDVQLWLLRGVADEASPSGEGQHGGESSLKYYLKALELSPGNFAAHHYLTHSYENVGQIEEALKHGEAYSRLCPAIPHAQHMYGHDLRRVGRIMDAIRQFRKAYDLEMAYYATEKIPAEYDWHHEHNLDLLSTSYQYIGQMKQAGELMKEAFDQPAIQANLEFNKKEWPVFLLSRGQTEEALQASKTLAGSNWPLVSAIGHVMESRAELAMNKPQEASAEANAALSQAKSSAAVFSYIKADMAVLQGEFLLRTGQMEKGRSILQAVETSVRAENGPDAWTQALFTLEAIAQIARDSGDWTLAEYTAGQMIQHDPNYAGSHYALALVKEHSGDKIGAVAEYKLATKYWANADADLA
ncbi:MAG: tetratricopeptide repeat protein, partial [Blastocatellia bacterium]